MQHPCIDVDALHEHMLLHMLFAITIMYLYLSLSLTLSVSALCLPSELLIAPCTPRPEWHHPRHTLTPLFRFSCCHRGASAGRQLFGPVYRFLARHASPYRLPAWRMPSWPAAPSSGPPAPIPASGVLADSIIKPLAFSRAPFLGVGGCLAPHPEGPCLLVFGLSDVGVQDECSEFNCVFPAEVYGGICSLIK